MSLSIMDLKQKITSELMSKYNGKGNDPEIVDFMKADVAAIMANAMSNKTVTSYDQLWVRKIDDKSFQVKLRIFPIFIGSTIKFDLKIGV